MRLGILGLASLGCLTAGCEDQNANSYPNLAHISVWRDGERVFNGYLKGEPVEADGSVTFTVWNHWNGQEREVTVDGYDSIVVTRPVESEQS